MDKYEIQELIGTGSYGKVHKARIKATKEVVAVKIIDRLYYESKERKNFEKEFKIHATLNHPNIIRLLDSFETLTEIVFVTEFADIDLHKYLKRKNAHFNESQIQKLAIDLISALCYLHSNRVLHRDLKPQNILLNENTLQAKLCDFGLARNMTPETHMVTSIKGTPLYMAPEVIKGVPYDHQADFWSLGCILFEVLVGHPPFPAKSFDRLFELHKKDIVWPDLSEEYHECKSFLSGLLHKIPEKRFNWKAILEHSYIKDKLTIMPGSHTNSSLINTLTESQNLEKERQRSELIQKSKLDILLAKKATQRNPPAKNGHQRNRQRVPTAIDDNESVSSRDSVEAIVQTDLENIETDVDVPSSAVATPLMPKKVNANTAIEAAGHSGQKAPSENQNLVIKRFCENFVVPNEKAIASIKMAQKGDAAINTNLVIGTMEENLQKDRLVEQQKSSKFPKENSAPNSTASHLKSANNETRNDATTASAQYAKSKELEMRKLSQNLDNFSIRLGNKSSANETEEGDRKSESKKAEIHSPTTKNERNAYDNYQISPIENEEWLAFIRTSMQEILNGEFDSLKQQNLVEIIVAILRNVNASCKVIESVVQLLTMPLILPISATEELNEIKNIYVQAKLLPNLIFASKLICMVRPAHESLSSTESSSLALSMSMSKDNVLYRKMSDLSVDELRTLSNIYELSCHLIHLNGPFLIQFCESIDIIANDLMIHILANVIDHPMDSCLIGTIIAMLCFALRELPENADIVEKILFNTNVDIVALLKHQNDVVKSRMCMLLRIASRFCCLALQNAWSSEIREALNDLQIDHNEDVQNKAKSTVDEMSYLSFTELTSQ